MPPRKTTATTKTAAPTETAAKKNEPDTPTVLRYSQDGSIVPPEEFGGPGGPADEGAVELGTQDAALVPAPRQEVQDETSAFDHKVLAYEPEDEE